MGDGRFHRSRAHPPAPGRRFRSHVAGRFRARCPLRSDFGAETRV